MINATEIEKNGITIVRNFLFESQLVYDHIKEDDKEPSWDGNLIIFKSPNHNNKKDQIKGRISVQVKSTKRKPKKKESFSIERSDLENYLNDGGIIFIRPIYTLLTSYTVFAKILLPVTIKELLDKNQTKKKIPVILEKIDNVKLFESMCFHFLENRPLQSNIKNLIDVNSIPFSHSTNIFAKVIKRANIPDTFFSDNCYFYYKTKDNIIAPLNFKIDRLEFENSDKLKIDNEVYFNKIKLIREKNNAIYFQLNPVIKLSFDGDKLNFKIDSRDNNLFIDTLNAFKFLDKLTNAKSFFIGSKEFSYSSFEMDNSYKDQLRFFEDIFTIISAFKINYDKITISNLNKDKDILLKLLSCFIDKKEIKLEHKKEHFLQDLNFLNKKIVLLFKFNNTNTFQIYNFITENPFNTNYFLHINDKNIPCSRFLGLTKIKVESIKSIDGYFSEVTNDLKKYYHTELIDPYNFLMLNSIKIYDETKNDNFLLLADTLNELMDSNNPKDDVRFHNVCIINRFQIKKRKEILSNEEKRLLLELKSNNSDYSILICCVNILLDSFAEFEIRFEELNNKEKEEFQSWPIWNLYKKA